MGNILRGLAGATLLSSLLTACVPAAPAPTRGFEVSQDAAAPGDETGSPTAAPAKAARLFSQAEVET